MARGVSHTSSPTPPRGAARVADVRGVSPWTAPGTSGAVVQAGGSLPTAGTLRGGQQVSSATVYAGATTGLTITSQLYRGLPCARLTYAGTTNGVLSAAIQAQLTPALERPAAGLDSLGLAWSIRAQLAYTHGVPANADVGLTLLLGAGANQGGGVLAQGNSNVNALGIVLDPSGTFWRFRARQKQGASTVLTLDTPLAGGPARVDEWNDVGFIFAPPTPSADAELRVMLGGRVAVRYAWGAGSLLPTYSAGGVVGEGTAWLPLVMFGSAVAQVPANTSLYLAGWQVTAAQSVADLDY